MRREGSLMNDPFKPDAWWAMEQESQRKWQQSLDHEMLRWYMNRQPRIDLFATQPERQETASRIAVLLEEAQRLARTLEDR